MNDISFVSFMEGSDQPPGGKCATANVSILLYDRRDMQILSILNCHIKDNLPDIVRD